MKKLLIFVLALGFCVICTPPNQAFATGSNSSQTKQSEPPYKAFIVVEALRGEVIEGENASAKRAPASITKLMLASVVMEKIALSDINNY